MPKPERSPEPRIRSKDLAELEQQGTPSGGTPSGGTPTAGTPLLTVKRPPRASTPSTATLSPSRTGTPPAGTPRSGSPQPESAPGSRRPSLLPPSTDSRRSSITKKALTGIVKDAKKGIKDITDTSLKAGQKVADSTRAASEHISHTVESTAKKVKDKTVSVTGHVKDASQWVASQTSKTAKAAMEQAKSGLSIGEKFTLFAVEKISTLSRRGFTHVFMFLILAGYTALGAGLFILIESPNEREVMEVAEVASIAARKDILDERNKLLQQLWVKKQRNMNWETWEKEVKPLLIDFETLQHERHSTVEEFEDMEEVWSFWKTMFFCSTITTTIGYGHIYPSTNAGRALTIVYAILGIPIFLILMADFGKLFTRLLKALFVFVRRVYRTATCRRIRKTKAVQTIKTNTIPPTPPSPTPPLALPESMSGEFDNTQRDDEPGHLRRTHQVTASDTRNEEDGDSDLEEPRPCCLSSCYRTVSGWCSKICCKNAEEEAEEDTVIDDNFNLPISLALFILLLYILIGCFIYTIWEEWSYFTAFYFIFISMTTIGFGDLVPQHPAFMMMTTVYLVFGLALTAMCINIIQEKLTDTFRKASEKLKESLGHIMATAMQGEEGGVQEGKQVEVAEVHGAKMQAAEPLATEKVTVKKET